MNRGHPKRLLGFLVLLFSLAVSACGPSIKDLIKQDPSLEKYVKEFLEPYHFFINEDEKKAFLALRTNQDRDQFIANFLKARDPDKNTPENEWKNEIDKRIEFIKNEGFRIDSGSYGYNILGFQFSMNGGSRGNAARVFLIHGMPQKRGQLIDRTSWLTDLMVWIYTDSSGNEIYRFLFYQKRGMPPFVLFNAYAFPPTHRLYELSRRELTDPHDYEAIIRDLYNLYTYDPEGLFVRAIQEFSPVSNLTPDKVLETPLSADELVRLFQPRVYGQPPKLPKGTVMDYNDSFSRLMAIPRVISSVGANSSKTFSFRWYIVFKNLDWKIVGDKAETVLKTRAIFINESNGDIFTYLGLTALIVPADMVNSPRAFLLEGGMKGMEDQVTNLKLNDFINQKLSPGNYTAILHLKDARTNKNIKRLIKFAK